MKIEILQLGYLYTNCYFLIKENKLIIIDPADEYEKIKEKIGSLELVGVIVTHNHSDHIGALEELIENFDTKVYNFKNLKEGINKIDVFDFEVIYTPGHTRDSITIYFEEEKVMFVGDFIFKDTIGRTDLPTGNFVTMENSITKIKKYPNVTIYSGHGDSTTLEYEKNNNEFF